MRVGLQGEKAVTGRRRSPGGRGRGSNPTGQPRREWRTSTVSNTPLLRVWGPLIRELPESPVLGGWVRGREQRANGRAPSLHLHNSRETQWVGGEGDTRAEPTLTISIDFYPSPPGNPGQKEKEDRRVRKPWNAIRERLWAPDPQPSLKEKEAGPLPPRAVPTPNPIPGTGKSQGTGFQGSPPPHGEGRRKG